MPGRVAIVTGAGGDIGRAIAATLLADGYAVLVADIREGAARATAEALKGEGRVVAASACDITDLASVAAMAATARGLGAVVALVNNAGGVTSASLQEATAGDFRADLALNLEGAFNVFKAVEADLKANRGAIVNIASVNGLGVFGHPGYSAAKAALIHLTHMLAVEYGKFGLRANAVAPGTVATAAWRARAEANPNVFEEARRWYPLGRVARTEDIANAVSFLLSDKAAAITGVCLPVDCGLTAGLADLARTFTQSSDF